MVWKDLSQIAIYDIRLLLLQSQSICTKIGDNLYPTDCTAFEKLVSNMSFSLTLNPAVAESTGGIKKLVSKYGLLEPNREDMAKMACGAKIKRLFLMKLAQQLIALYMLDVGDGMLESTYVYPYD
jgi:hypothetical protein